MISEHASPLATLGGVDAGGQNAHVAALACTVAALGHEVRVYTRRDGPQLPPVAALAPGVDVVHVPAGPARPIPKDDLPPYMDEFGRWLGAAWRRADWRPDVVHAHFWMSGLAALTARRYLATPLVQTYHALGTVKRRHQGSADTSPPGRVDAERRIGLAAERIVAQCTDEVAELAAMGITGPAVAVVPSGVDTRRFSPRGPAAPHGDGLRILSVGRLVPRKGHAELIDALVDVPGAELVIIGGGDAGRPDDDPQHRALRERARAAGVADRVRLTGAVDASAMPAWYRSADIVACAPWYEPFGLTPLEAMASGVPVVGYGVGGLLDTVVPKVTGELVGPRDTAALAAALRDLTADRRQRRRYGVAGLRRARTYYRWPAVAERIVAIYRNAAKEFLAGELPAPTRKAVTAA
jgi:glycosyltransferase involved in cell wall biosynthesis